MPTATATTAPMTLTEPRRISVRAHGRARVKQLLKRGLAAEAAGWRSIFRGVLRRPAVAAGSSAHRYDAPIRTILIIFIVLSAIEVPVVDLITHPWPWVRFPLMALGVWGVATMLGMLFGYTTRPHAVGPEGIIARNGGEISVTLPWADIASVTRHRRSLVGAPSASLTGSLDDPALNLVVQDGTDVDIELEQPTRITLPQGEVVVTSVRLSVDDVPAFMDAVRTHIP